MFRRALLMTLLCLCAAVTAAEDLDNLQIHGFATQGFLYSTNNNYLTMKSSDGSLQWTEGALSLNDAVSDKLRVGLQIHMYQMGEIGGPQLVVDWASGDYKVNDNLGFRVGKVKTPFGLFNDSQDVDALFLWVLLPQCNYPDDNRDFDLAVLGGEAYGRLSFGDHGRVQYRGYVGESRLDANGGYMLQLSESGLTFPSPPSGKAVGGDLRWATPVDGLSIGASAERQGLDGSGPQGTVHIPPVLGTVYYAEWKKGKWYVAGEYLRMPMTIMAQVGTVAMAEPIDQRSWYPMVSYQLTRKLQVGTYYSHYINKAADTSLPEIHSKDWVISSRYNFNANFYGKVEGHFLHGTGIGYYESVNPDGLKPNTAMLAARIGFTF
ncbi:MAG: hypothetical protein JOZ80_09260 [Acidobacteriaceae bacterium]|nr:hypothetical protein [Acidobacteriaceae bacterium]